MWVHNTLVLLIIKIIKDLNMDLNLNGKKAFVAGGSRGMGKAIAKVLVEEGVDVAIAARDIERLENAANDIRKNIKQLLTKEGPNFLEILVNTGSRNNLSRPSSTPKENMDQFMKNINNDR